MALIVEEDEALDPVEFISIEDILCLRGKEVTAMGNLRFTDIEPRPTEVLDLTSLTLEGALRNS